jgi:hypothetical protein
LFAINTTINTPSSKSTAGFGLQLPLEDYAQTALIADPNPTDTIVPLTPPPIVGGIVTVPAPPNLTISTVTIGGITYTFTLNSPPAPGQFTVINGTIQIGYLGLVPPLAIGYYAQPMTIPTDRILPPFPNLFTQFPISGELNWTLTWEEQPQANLEFITDASFKSSVLSYFSGTGTINIYGVGFAPSAQVNITEISPTKSATPLIKVTVTLTGKHARYLDLYTFTGKQLVLPDCTAAPFPALNSPTSMTVQDLAIKVGASVVGAAIAIDPSILNAPAVATNLGANLDAASIRGIGAFVDYNNPTGIILKPYGSVAGHNAIARSDIQTSVNRKIGTQYYKTYDPLTKISFGAKPYTPPSPIPAPAWLPVPLVTTTTTEGDVDPSITAYPGTQRDLSIVFDISGKRKRRKDIKLINGQPISETEQEWGYVAVAKDNVIFDTSANPGIASINGLWRQIMAKSTTYNYNPLGYLISVTSTGWILTRFRVENAQNSESLAIRIGTPPDPLEVASLETYRFFELPTSSSEIYKLAKMADYFDDITTPKVNYTICLADGSGTIDIPIDDEAYIPPYFVKSKRVVESGFASTVNPKSTALKPLQNLTTGKSTEFIERTGIEPLPALTIVGGQTNPKYYTKSTDNYAAQGAQFGINLSIAESQLINGRPPVATNRGPIVAIVAPPTSPTTPVVPVVPFAVKSGLSTENTGYVTVASLNFPTAATKTQATLAAQIDIDLINTRNTQVESLLIDWNPSIRPGDFVSYQVGIDTRTRRVISVTQALKIEGLLDSDVTIVTSAGTVVKLGVIANTPLQVVTLPVPTTTISI